MKISLKDFITMLKELMGAVGYQEEQINTSLTKLQEGYIDLYTLVSNVAVQCFVTGHKSPNSDIIRTYLFEHRKNQGEVEFK